MRNGYTRLALIGAVVAFGAFATAAVLFVATGSESLQRLALLFGLFGVTVPSVIGVLKADQASTATNETSSIAKALDGQFDVRVQDAAQRANEATAAGESAPPLGAPGTGADTPAHVDA